MVDQNPEVSPPQAQYKSILDRAHRCRAVMLPEQCNFSEVRAGTERGKDLLALRKVPDHFNFTGMNKIESAAGIALTQDLLARAEALRHNGFAPRNFYLRYVGWKNRRQYPV
jgi:hypothetical protein